jgi:DegV family protein with EDD domain
VIKLVTDSTFDLAESWRRRYPITVVPVNIQFGLETFQERVNLEAETFYSRIKSSGSLPTTSQPAVGEFKAIYERLGADGSEILSIHLTSKLSGTWQTALLAAQQVTAKVTVLDSLTGSVGLGLMVREAAELVEAGRTVDEIVACLEQRRSQIMVCIMLKDLQFARMSGRVGRLRETLASLLSVKPIVGVDQGYLVPLDRVRGQKQGLERMLALAEEAVGQAPVHLAVAHAMDYPLAETLLALTQARLNCQDAFSTDLALSLAVHFGPGAVGFAIDPAQ